MKYRVHQVVKVQILQTQKVTLVLLLMYTETEQVPHLQTTFCLQSAQQHYRGLDVVCHLNNTLPGSSLQGWNTSDAGVMSHKRTLARPSGMRLTAVAQLLKTAASYREISSTKFLSGLQCLKMRCAEKDPWF